MAGMYKYAMGKIAENLKHKSAYFSAHNTSEQEIIAYFKKEVDHICIEQGVPTISPTTVDDDGNTLLFHMAEDGVAMLVPLMIAMGYDPTHRNKRHESVLHIACNRALLNNKPFYDVVDFIDNVRTYGNWNDENKNGQTPLFSLVQMYERWKDINQSLWPDSKFERNTVALIEKAIAEGADIHHRDHQNNTFVSKATSECLAPFQSLIEKQIIEQHMPKTQVHTTRKM